MTDSSTLGKKAQRRIAALDAAKDALTLYGGTSVFGTDAPSVILTESSYTTELINLAEYIQHGLRVAEAVEMTFPQFLGDLVKAAAERCDDPECSCNTGIDKGSPDEDASEEPVDGDKTLLEEGEKPERVEPLSKLVSGGIVGGGKLFGGSGVTINVSPGPVPEATAARVSQQIDEASRIERRSI